MSEIDDKTQLALLESKRNAYFTRMQSIYDLCKQDITDEQSKETFLNNIINLEDLRSSYQRILDEVNVLYMKLHPKSTINYQSWICFEDLYCHVKRFISESNLQPTTKAEPSVPKFRQNLPSLPPIELITFNGDVRNWSTFYHQFKNVVHNNQQLSDTEKIYYLVGKLRDKAATVCAGLAPTAENYHIIWDALVRKYDDPRSLAASYVNQLLNFKPIPSNSAVGLESFIDNFDSSVRALKQLKLHSLGDFII